MARRRKEDGRVGSASGGMVRRSGRFFPGYAIRVSLSARGCLSGATPRGQPWTAAVPLSPGRNGLNAWRMTVLSTCREPSLCRHVHHELLRSVLLDLTSTIAATTCHQRNDVERYCRSIVERLIAAQGRGVHVRILCGGRHGLSDYDILDTFASLRIMQRSGIRMHRQKHLKLHAKLILADGSRAVLGSMNIDRSAFDLRRELGIGVDDQAIIARLRRMFTHEWEHSHRYEVPDPLEAEKPSDDELPHDPEFTHE